MRWTGPTLCIAVGLLGAGLLDTRIASAGEHVTIDKVPAAVRATAQRETKGGKIVDIETDHVEGVLVYEVEFTLDGKKFELEIAADGKLLDRHPD